MGFHLLPMSAFLALITLAASFELTPQVYWNSVLTNTPMPKSIAKLVPNEVGPASAFYRHEAYDPNPFDDDDRFYWLEEETADKLLEDPTQDLFYLESDLHPGTTMKYSLARREKSMATFLPRNTAESTPFSSAKLPEMLNQFSVKPDSLEARTMQQTVDSCESSLLQQGEDRKCATSLESMIDLATSKLGSRDIRAIPTEVGEGAVRLQNYTIAPGMKKLAEAGKDKVVLCHKRTYGYAVFYCHSFGTKVRAYEVPLQGSDGTKAKAVAICHTDTSHWQPKSFPLQVLNIKPGTVTVCHFIPEGDIAWVPNPKPT